MSMKYRMALGVSPLLLRLALAVTFIWAGLGKIMATDVVQGEMAAILGNMGVLKPTTGAGGGAGGGSGGADGVGGGAVGPTTPLPPPTEDVGTPRGTDGSVNAGSEVRIHRVSQDAGAPAGSSPGAVVPVTPSAAYTAADFPDPVSVKRVNLLAAGIWMAAHPAAKEDGTVPPALWPPALGEGRLPLIFAYLVVAAELGGGVLVLLGLLTRFGAFSLAVVMVGAMWLTQIGPALQKGKTVMGFLPDYPKFGEEWTYLLLQFVLAAMALALMLSGPGYMAVDHALFGGRRRRRGDDDGE